MSKSMLSLLLAPALALAATAGASQPPTAPNTRSQASAAWSEDGLQKVSVKGLDVVYARPGASLAGYGKVLLRPIVVSFRRNWERQEVPGTHMRISARDSQRIKDNLAALVHDQVVRQLRDGGYQLVESPGDDVLEVDMSINNLWVNAPDLSTSARTSYFAVSAGEMTLVAELRDSSSGDIVMRVYDHATGRTTPRPQRISNVDNVQEATVAAMAWAKALRGELDLARGVK